jgi:hypothetical protein
VKVVPGAMSRPKHAGLEHDSPSPRGVKMGTVAYRLALLPSFSFVHSVFHISMLHNYLCNPSYVLQPQTIEF